ncbi:MAG: hypothetical protein ACRERE_39825 [Candidatus Entotheonellia bacterium]
MRLKERVCLFLRVGGTAFILIGLSHFFVPSLFRWGESLKGVDPVHVLGVEVYNPAFLYLFNADLLLYEVMLGVLSILFSYRIRKGERSVAIFSISLGVFFLIRTPLQFLYFGFTWIDKLQAAVSFLLALIYLFPLINLKEFDRP